MSATDEGPHSARWGRVLLANVVGVALLLALLEGGVRVVRPDIGPAGAEASLLQSRAFADRLGTSTGLRPGATGVANGERVAVDDQGFHVYAGNAARPASGPGSAGSAGVWLWLGDSVAFGIGVPADSTLAGRLALAQDTARVLNPSVIGWGTADYRRRLDAALAGGLRPDRVTLVWCLNDADPARPSQRGDVSRVESARRNGISWLNRHSRLYRLAKGVALDRPARYFAHDRRLYARLGAPQRSAEAGGPGLGIDRALSDLWAIRDTLAARGVPLEVVVVPYEPQLRPGGDSAPQRLLAARLRQRGIAALDLLVAFRAYGGDPADLYLWSDGIHLSAEGHRLAARAVAGWRR